MLEVAQDVWGYVTQMIPLGLSALVILMLLGPIRKKRLSQLNLVSSARRETALVLFVVFAPGWRRSPYFLPISGYILFPSAEPTRRSIAFFLSTPLGNRP